MRICEPQPEHTPIIQGEILDQFYAPVEFDSLSMLVSEFERERARIVEVHEIITQERVSGVMGYFFAGNSSDGYGGYASLRHTNSFDEIFRLEGALNELTATFWSRALSQTDLMDYMPQARRDEWHKSLNAWREHGYKRGENVELDLPEFTLDTLRATVQSLLARRSEFLAERVDGIFRGLSRSHVTNVPEGFGKRMIMSRVYNEWGSTCSSSEGVIHDLRLVIAKFMGRDDPSRGSTSQLLKTARAARGEWIEADCGALRVRGYQVGTAHLEVHPEMAYRLNMVLAALYPAAIPESFRTRPKRGKGCSFKSKALFERPFSNAVGAILAGATPYKKMVKTDSFRHPFEHVLVRNAIALPDQTRGSSKHLKAEVATVMQGLGGVLTNCSEHPRMTYWQFDFDALDLVHEVAVLGYIPDQKSHQFYPTPQPVAQQLVDWLDICLLDTVCEPQAGQGGIADLLPKDRTRCVEISPLHCEILRKKGHNVIEGDFLSWNPGGELFTVIAMNPPFSEGRWQAHLKHAGDLLASKGRLGAVLPLSAKRTAGELLPGFDLEFSSPIDNAFSGTSISVVLLKAIKH
ncbi:DUF4942 domain-containing protein [Pseudomonas triclosanedens]|uniref:DUF4942 domain-containing protein n=1 Tax=Pseudomonas triclosanedens TaxID=2961893 RepID=UPI0020C1D1CC|nr:DUF4942 domain-containing protein [Pseudomonas triclosanedens]MCP8473800.1 DUF4942 domain-containing protein [Pseudomonas triclosanedens]